MERQDCYIGNDPQAALTDAAVVDNQIKSMELAEVGSGQPECENNYGENGQLLATVSVNEIQEMPSVPSVVNCTIDSSADQPVEMNPVAVDCKEGNKLYLNEIPSKLEDVVVHASTLSNSDEAMLEIVSETLKELVSDVINMKTTEIKTAPLTEGFEDESETKMSEQGASKTSKSLTEVLGRSHVTDIYQRREVQHTYESEREEDSDSVDSDSDSSSSSSSPSSEDDESSSDGDATLSEEESTLNDILTNKGKKSFRDKRAREIRTKGELALEDLPPIQDLKISVDKKEIHHVGHILTIVDRLVIVQSIIEGPALNLDSILFLGGGEPLGQIFDVFGPVVRPLYSVRFNTTDDISEKKITLGCSVFYAPRKSEFTSFVFAEQLLRMKGSDASWENNNEPPEGCLEYSDDEQEKLAKARLKNRDRRESGWNEQQQPRPKMPMRRLNRKQNQAKQSNIEQNYAIESAPSAIMTPTSFQPRFQQTSPLRPPSTWSKPVYQNTKPYANSSSLVRSSNPFYTVPQSSVRPYSMGVPSFVFHQPPPPPPPRPDQMPISCPRVQSPRASVPMQRPISALFKTQSQQITTQSCLNAQSSSAASSDLLPNPFRTQSNASSESKPSSGPRFPPLGFIPRM